MKHLTHKEAIVGVSSGAKKVLFNTYNRLMGGIGRAFDTEEEAKEWLIEP
jgi:hypothetical protein